MPDERRTSRRARLNGVRVTYESASGERQDADARDLSRTGLFIVTSSPSAIGKRLSLEIQVAGEPGPWPALGRVVWVRAGDGGAERPAGMGVKLIDIEDEIADAIDKLVAAREPTEPGMGQPKPDAPDDDLHPEVHRKEVPARERTMLGVGAPAELAPETPVVVVAPPREATLLGPGEEAALARETGDDVVATREASLPIDLVAKKAELEELEEPLALEPLAAGARDAPTFPPAGRRKRGNAGCLVWGVVLIGAAAAAYALRDRIPADWSSRLGLSPAASSSPSSPVTATPAPTPAATSVPTATAPATAGSTPAATAAPGGTTPAASSLAASSARPSATGSAPKKRPATPGQSATPAPHKAVDENPY